jgi:hypothetical protein
MAKLKAVPLQLPMDDDLRRRLNTEFVHEAPLADFAYAQLAPYAGHRSNAVMAYILIQCIVVNYLMQTGLSEESLGELMRVKGARIIKAVITDKVIADAMQAMLLDDHSDEN